MPNDAITSALIGFAGLAIGGLLAALPKILESTTTAGRSRAEARRAEAEAQRIDAENELNRAQRDFTEITRLSMEIQRLRKKLLDHNIDPSDSRPMEMKR